MNQGQEPLDTELSWRKCSLEEDVNIADHNMEAFVEEFETLGVPYCVDKPEIAPILGSNTN